MMYNIYIQRSTFDMKNKFKTTTKNAIKVCEYKKFTLLHFQNLYSNFTQFLISIKISNFLLTFCGTKCEVKKNTERNGKNFCLNGFLGAEFLDSS